MCIWHGLGLVWICSGSGLVWVCSGSGLIWVWSRSGLVAAPAAAQNKQAMTRQSLTDLGSAADFCTKELPCQDLPGGRAKQTRRSERTSGPDPGASVGLSGIIS